MALDAPEPAALADDETVITSLIVSGLGVALVRDEVARARAGEGELVIWPGAAIETTLWFVYPVARADEPAIAALIDMVRGAWNLNLTHGQATAKTAA